MASNAINRKDMALTKKDHDKTVGLLVGLRRQPSMKNPVV